MWTEKLNTDKTNNDKKNTLTEPKNSLSPVPFLTPQHMIAILNKLRQSDEGDPAAGNDRKRKGEI